MNKKKIKVVQILLTLKIIKNWPRHDQKTVYFPQKFEIVKTLQPNVSNSGGDGDGVGNGDGGDTGVCSSTRWAVAEGKLSI